MTYERVIANLIYAYSCKQETFGKLTMDDNEAENLAIDALKKYMVTMTPMVDTVSTSFGSETFYTCPACHVKARHIGTRYCEWCGQRLK